MAIQRHKSNWTRRRGFALLELAIMLGVAGAVIAGIWAAASVVAQHHKVSQAVEQVQQIVDNIRTRYNAAAQLPNESWAAFTQTTARADAFPVETKLSPAVLPANCGVGAAPCYFASPWGAGDAASVCGGGALCVSAIDVFGLAAARYSIVVTLRQLPQGACVELAGKFAAIWNDVGLVALGVDVGDVNVPGTVYGAPPSPAVLAAGCNAANPNNLYLAFRLAAS